jgi:hypothetical protein
MSVVGPRPAFFNPGDLVELRAAAGVNQPYIALTGWAGLISRDELPIPEGKDKSDSPYLEWKSLLFDLKIVSPAFSMCCIVEVSLIELNDWRRLSGRNCSGPAARRIRAVTPQGRGTGPRSRASHRHERQHSLAGAGLMARDARATWPACGAGSTGPCSHRSPIPANAVPPWIFATWCGWSPLPPNKRPSRSEHTSSPAGRTLQHGGFTPECAKGWVDPSRMVSACSRADGPRQVWGRF